MDPRVRQTRWQLQDALRELVAEKGYRAVSVQDIAARANVNRTTFYLHYKDKDQLLEHVAEDLVQRAARLHTVEPRQPGATPLDLVAFFEQIEASCGFYEQLVGSEARQAFVPRLERFIERESLQRLEQGTSLAGRRDVPPTLQAKAVASTMVSVLSWWLEQGRPQGALGAAEWTLRLLRTEEYHPGVIDR